MKSRLDIKKKPGSYLIASFFGSLCTVLFLYVWVWGLSSHAFIDTIFYPMSEKKIYNDDAILIISERCALEETDLLKVYCVHSIFSAMFVYDDNRTKTMFKTPSTTLIEGGVCRDAVLIYCAIFNRLGIPCSYKSVDEHVFNIIELEGMYCIIDQQTIHCQ